MTHDGSRQAADARRKITPAILDNDGYRGLAGTVSIRAQQRIPGSRARGKPGQSGTGTRRVLFATRTGRRLFAADVGQILRRLAAQAALPADLSGHLGPHAMRHTFAALYQFRGRRIAPRPSGRHGAFRRPHHPALRPGRAHSPSYTRTHDRRVPASAGLVTRRRSGRPSPPDSRPQPLGGTSRRRLHSGRLSRGCSRQCRRPRSVTAVPRALGRRGGPSSRSPPGTGPASRAR